MQRLAAASSRSRRPLWIARAWSADPLHPDRRTSRRRAPSRHLDRGAIHPARHGHTAHDGVLVGDGLAQRVGVVRGVCHDAGGSRSRRPPVARRPTILGRNEAHQFGPGRVRPRGPWCSGPRKSLRPGLQLPFLAPLARGGRGRWWSRRLGTRSPDHRTSPRKSAAIRPSSSLRLNQWKAPFQSPNASEGRARASRCARSWGVLHERPVVTARRAFLIKATNDQPRHPSPTGVAQLQTIHHAQGRLLKGGLES